MYIKKWIFSVFIIVLLSLCSIITFNYFINPYGVFVHDKSKELVKNRSINSEMTKFYYASYKNPDVLIVGTSRLEHINPKYLKKYLKGSIYNIGVKGSGIKTHYNIIKYFTSKKNVKTIILGLDFFSFNPVNIQNINILQSRYSDYFINDYKDSLLSFRTFRKSISTLMDNIKDKKAKINFQTGWESYNDDYLTYEKYGDDWLDKRVNSHFPNFGQDKHFFDNPRFKNPKSIDRGLKILDDIIKHCKEYNINLILFTTPIYYKIYDVIKGRGYGNTYKYWKKSLSKYNFIYDFNYKNGITKDYKWYIDASHFQSRLGKLIFARIYNDKDIVLPSDFGRLLKEEK